MKVTIALPVYNSEKTIAESIESALSQSVRGKEILVLDDGSTDSTAKIVSRYSGQHVRLIHNMENAGIGSGLAKLMDNAKGDIVVYLCGDDQFTHPLVVSDIVDQFKANPKLGILGRYYYQYMDGYPGAIMVSRDRQILTQSCNPSGMAFRRMPVKGVNKIFIECPSIVKQYLEAGHEWSMLEYDTIRARIHPGGNTGTKETYYQGSMYKNWRTLLGEPLKFHQGYVQIKNRAPKKLWEEICQSLVENQKALLDPTFWLYVIIAVSIPGSVLRPLSNFYRHRITRKFVRIIERT